RKVAWKASSASHESVSRRRQTPRTIGPCRRNSPSKAASSRRPTNALSSSTSLTPLWSRAARNGRRPDKAPPLDRLTMLVLPRVAQHTPHIVVPGGTRSGLAARVSVAGCRGLCPARPASTQDAAPEQGQNRGERRPSEPVTD